MIRETTSRRWRSIRLFSHQSIRHVEHSGDLEPDVDVGEESAHFTPRAAILDVVEQQLFHALSEAFYIDGVVFPKVRVSDVICVDGWKGMDGAVKIDRKTIDMVVCRRDSFEPRLAVRIDRWLQESGRYQTRDATVNRAILSAGLTVMHVRSDRIPEPGQIRDRFAALLS